MFWGGCPTTQALLILGTRASRDHASGLYSLGITLAGQAQQGESRWWRGSGACLLLFLGLVPKQPIRCAQVLWGLPSEQHSFPFPLLLSRFSGWVWNRTGSKPGPPVAHCCFIVPSKPPHKLLSPQHFGLQSQRAPSHPPCAKRNSWPSRAHAVCFLDSQHIIAAVGSSTLDAGAQHHPAFPSSSNSSKASVSCAPCCQQAPAAMPAASWSPHPAVSAA